MELLETIYKNLGDAGRTEIDVMTNTTFIKKPKSTSKKRKPEKAFSERGPAKDEKKADFYVEETLGINCEEYEGTNGD